MDLQIEGKIINVLPEQSGVSRAGNNWKKREYVLETQETYPKKVHFDLFGERADQFPLKAGDNIRLFFDINSREYNGRWYTSISGWKVEHVTSDAGTAVPPQSPVNQLENGPVPPVVTNTPDFTAAPGDDLPF